MSDFQFVSIKNNAGISILELVFWWFKYELIIGIYVVVELFHLFIIFRYFQIFSKR